MRMRERERRIIVKIFNNFVQLVHASLMCLAALAQDNTVCASIIMTGEHDFVRRV